MNHRKIEVERSSIAELDAQIAAAQATLLEQKRRMGGVNAAKENHSIISKQIRVFESRLDKSLARFNESLGRNKDLRGQVDDLRQERVVFDGVYKKLERELHDRKKEMAAIIEDSKNAYQARDQAHAELSSLRDNVETEQGEFEREWEKLGRVMEEELRLRETLGRMAPSSSAPHEGGLASLATGRSLTRLASSQPAGGDGGTDGGETQPPIGEEGGEHMDSAALFEDSFDRIREATGATDVDELVGRFLSTEDKNFRLFNFVNGVNAEVERLEGAIAATRAETEAFRGVGAGSNAQKKKVLREMAAHLEKIETKTVDHETSSASSSETIAQLRNGIQSIFTRLGANRGLGSGDDSAADEVLGNQGVTETNMMQHLSIIEGRITEVLESFVQSLHVDVEVRLTDEALGVGSGLADLAVVPPAFEDLSDHEGDSDHDDSERPLSRGEVHRRTLRRGAQTSSPTK